ncbi:rCG50109 [Rattus norvegicus]|uniref:RCG50109 n=1 Tax=Rattus norvegicus TaxID=10116 RepID=A6JVA9_RAT|nr:rCG50109 [Rattus norvegicus]
MQLSISSLFPGRLHARIAAVSKQTPWKESTILLS